MKVGQILKMQDGNEIIEVVVTETKARNYFKVRPINTAITFSKVSYKGKAFNNNAIII